MPNDRTITGALSAVTEQKVGTGRKKKRPSGIIKGKREAMGKDLERTPAQELMMDVLGGAHEGLASSKASILEPIKGAISGALVGAQIGEAVKKYKKRKRARSMGQDSM